MDNYLKELTKLANELDSKGLAEEADTLDSIIKEASAIQWLGELFGADKITCAQRTAGAMAMLPDHVRAELEGCDRKDYEYEVDDDTKIDIVTALKRIIQNDSSKQPVLQKYVVTNSHKHSVNFYKMLAQGKLGNAVTELLSFNPISDAITGGFAEIMKEKLVDERANLDLSQYTSKVDRQGNQIATNKL